MVQVLDMQATAPAEALRQVVDALEAGQLVALPGDAGYELVGHPKRDSVAGLFDRCLQAAPDRLAVDGFTLGVYGAGDAAAWVPELTELERRLTRRCWPGPLTLQLGPERTAILATRLPRTLGDPEHGWSLEGLRTPDSAFLLRALEQLQAPLLLLRLGPTGGSRLQEVLGPLGDAVSLAVDVGPLDDRPTTLVRVEGGACRVIRAGALTEEVLQRQMVCIILFVCTGNTCRSPLAEALCKKRLAERLGCVPEELPRHGYLVLSAGLAAFPGDRAAPEAAVAVRELGGDLEMHASRPLDPGLAYQADHVICMTQGHRQLLVEAMPSLCAPRLLRDDGQDVPDPIGQDQEVYRACAREIAAYVDRFLTGVVSVDPEQPQS